MEIWPPTLVMKALIWWEYLYECVRMMECGVLKLQCVYVSNFAAQFNGLLYQYIFHNYTIINGINNVVIFLHNHG